MNGSDLFKILMQKNGVAISEEQSIRLANFIAGMISVHEFIKKERDEAMAKLAAMESQESDGVDCAVAAIEYAIGTEEGLDFLRYWFYGEFDVLRRNWDNIPDRVFIGADPLFNSDRCPSHESEGE